jgi:hypothetical protein
MCEHSCNALLRLWSYSDYCGVHARSAEVEDDGRGRQLFYLVGNMIYPCRWEKDIP